MTKKVTLIAVVIMTMLLASHCVRADGCVVFNGSFENDGQIDSITPLDTPQRWSDVNIPPTLFGGYVYDGFWSTDGEHSLTLFSRPYRTFTNKDGAAISQQVYLQDVNEIIFDVELDTDYADPWDPAKRTAVVLIDDQVVWESNSVGSDVRGEYPAESYTVDDGYKDGKPHTLSLCLRSNVNESSITKYMARWDFVRFDTFYTYCEGFGYRAGDLNLDCFVDMNDLKLLAGQWLAEPAAHKYDMFEDADNIVNFRDFSVFADNWATDSFTYPPEDELLAGDLNNDGVVNFIDYAMLTKERNSGDYNDIGELAGQWLLKSWLYRLH